VNSDHLSAADPSEPRPGLRCRRAMSDAPPSLQSMDPERGALPSAAPVRSSEEMIGSAPSRPIHDWSSQSEFSPQRSSRRSGVPVNASSTVVAVSLALALALALAVAAAAQSDLRFKLLVPASGNSAR
jgi:hypothetical protein